MLAFWHPIDGGPPRRSAAAMPWNTVILCFKWSISELMDSRCPSRPCNYDQLVELIWIHKAS